MKPKGGGEKTCNHVVQATSNDLISKLKVNISCMTFQVAPNLWQDFVKYVCRFGIALKVRACEVNRKKNVSGFSEEHLKHQKSIKCDHWRTPKGTFWASLAANTSPSSWFDARKLCLLTWVPLDFFGFYMILYFVACFAATLKWTKVQERWRKATLQTTRSTSKCSLGNLQGNLLKTKTCSEEARVSHCSDVNWVSHSLEMHGTRAQAFQYIQQHVQPKKITTHM